ncbi:HNH endonuclease [Amphibacillus jilinensis]|uniref:HNH endonuclease n=1 Tax=Amphibacillus jilinensis TaxID=1216008 RepID=UPI00036A89D0|nr:HNH endonuclease [Amphibacillus jilinensis]
MLSEFHPYSKDQQIKKKRKRAKSKNFNAPTILAIFKRDNYRCVKCGNHLIDSVPHHITYRSQGGTGHKRNGVTVCRRCHDWAHHKCNGPFGEPSDQGRKWFEDWRERSLTEAGDRK